LSALAVQRMLWGLHVASSNLVGRAPVSGDAVVAQR